MPHSRSAGSALRFLLLRAARTRAATFRSQPLATAGGLAVAAYVIWLASRPVAAGAIGVPPAALRSVGSIAVAATVAAAWLWARAGRHGFALTGAERAFLAAGPISWWALLWYKFLRAQPSLVAGALVLGAALRPLLAAPFIRLAAAVYLVLEVLFLNRTLAAQLRGGVLSPRRARIARRAVLVGIGASFLVLGWNAMRVPWGAGWPAVSRAMDTLVAPPFDYLITPAFPTAGAAAAWSTLGIAVTLAALLAALAAAARRAPERFFAPPQPLAARSAPVCPHGVAVPRLAGPIGAIVWKNVRTVHRTQPLTQVFGMSLLAPIVLGITALPALRHINAFASGLASTWLLLLLVAGPMFIRNDLRLDLAHDTHIRLWPASPRMIVGAEIAAALLVLTPIQWLAFTLSAAALGLQPEFPLSRGGLVLLLLVLLAACPALNALTLAMHNAAALLFPKHVRVGMLNPGEGGSPGRVYVEMLLSVVLALLVTVMPAAVTLAFSLAFPHALPSLLAGCVLGLLVLYVEAGVQLVWLARLYERKGAVGAPRRRAETLAT